MILYFLNLNDQGKPPFGVTSVEAVVICPEGMDIQSTLKKKYGAMVLSQDYTIYTNPFSKDASPSRRINGNAKFPYQM